MSHHYEHVHAEGNDERFNMPYTAAIKVTEGRLVFISGVTAAAVYHSHPHVAAEFDAIPDDPAEQAERAMDNLEMVLEAAGGTLTDVIDLTRFMVAVGNNQDAINRVMGRRMGAHRPASTSVEVVRLATDPRLVLELRAVAVVAE
jgi:enamine deaminase RidA (YjgF/YER057c/UK114 family)